VNGYAIPCSRCDVPVAYRKLVDDCGWSPDDWERWVCELVERLLAR
jgi:hypothetical protein